MSYKSVSILSIRLYEYRQYIKYKLFLILVNLFSLTVGMGQYFIHAVVYYISLSIIFKFNSNFYGHYIPENILYYHKQYGTELHTELFYRNYNNLLLL